MSKPDTSVVEEAIALQPVNDDERQPSNSSGNRTFADVFQVYSSRRRVLQGGLALAATAFLAPAFGAGPAEAKRRGHRSLVGFEPVPIEPFPAGYDGTFPAISSDYHFDIILPWGDPIEPSGPAYSQPMDAANQTRQIGIGHDGMWYFPLRDPRMKRYGWEEARERDPWRGPRLGFGPGNRRGVLCLNHEFGRNTHVLGKPFPTSLEDVRLSQHAHGVSVIELEKKGGRFGQWRPVESQLSRRVHVNTPVRFSGPAAGHPLLENPIGNVPLGTVNNCSMGYTPWGTYLTCEENFNGYFGANDPAWVRSELQTRYGFSANGFGYGWHVFDKRFDLSDPDFQNEANRFGWVVEIDPMDPTDVPVKRTALGRFKHEGSTVHVGEGGRVVVYQGDDERWDYIYKFVSEDDWRDMRAAGRSPLDHGTLYVARFEDDGSGEWLELSMNVPELAAEFTDMAELLVQTRRAADLVGATPMDRPEWITVAPDGTVYCTLTNNSERVDDGVQFLRGHTVDTGPDGPNPIAEPVGSPNGQGNQDGHIVRWVEKDGFTGLRFEWEIFVIARDTHAAGDPRTFSDPDGLWADPDGRIFIQTDGGQKKGLQDQMLVVDPASWDPNDPAALDIRRIFLGVANDEITGIAVTPDRRTMFINVQHAGDGDPTRTNFPERFDGVTIPRDATIVITRKDGGIVGS